MTNYNFVYSRHKQLDRY